MIVDLHTHTTFSDGVLIPAESARRAFAAGYSGIALTDHADISNLEHILTSALRFKEAQNALDNKFAVLAGAELTHIQPPQIGLLAEKARALGADIVIMHGEVVTECVAPGTNRAAIEAGVDVIAHPGNISAEDVKLAAEKGVYLEISTRRGNAYSNGHVAAMAKMYGAKLVINNDFHSPGDYVGEGMALKILQGAGLSEAEALAVVDDTVKLFEKKLGKKFNQDRGVWHE